MTAKQSDAISNTNERMTTFDIEMKSEMRIASTPTRARNTHLDFFAGEA